MQRTLMAADFFTLATMSLKRSKSFMLTRLAWNASFFPHELAAHFLATSEVQRGGAGGKEGAHAASRASSGGEGKQLWRGRGRHSEGGLQGGRGTQTIPGLGMMLNTPQRVWQTRTNMLGERGGACPPPPDKSRSHCMPAHTCCGEGRLQDLLSRQARDVHH